MASATAKTPDEKDAELAREIKRAELAREIREVRQVLDKATGRLENILARLNSPQAR